MKINGTTKLNIIADGLLITDLRLAKVIALIALAWLYFIADWFGMQIYRKNIKILSNYATYVVYLHDRCRRNTDLK